MQLDSPQKAALRNELAGKDESIKLLRQQLLGVQNVAMSELQAQRNSFGGMAILYERKAREVARQEVEPATGGLT